MKTNLHEMFKADESLEKGGIWIDLNEKTGFLAKRFGGKNSPEIKKALAKYHKPFAFQIEKGTMDPDKEQEIFTRCFVESSMIDWKGVELDGKETEFSVDNAVKLFVELPELFEVIVKNAQDFENFKEIVGN